RLPRPMVGVFQAGRQADLQGLSDPLGHARPRHGNLTSNRRDGFASIIIPQNLSSLYLAPWRRLRTTQPFQSVDFLGGQHQLCTPRFSCHAAKHIRKAGPCEHLLTKRYTSHNRALLHPPDGICRRGRGDDRLRLVGAATDQRSGCRLGAVPSRDALLSPRLGGSRGGGGTLQFRAFTDKIGSLVAVMVGCSRALDFLTLLVLL